MGRMDDFLTISLKPTNKILNKCHLSHEFLGEPRRRASEDALCTRRLNWWMTKVTVKTFLHENSSPGVLLTFESWKPSNCSALEIPENGHHFLKLSFLHFSKVYHFANEDLFGDLGGKQRNGSQPTSVLRSSSIPCYMSSCQYPVLGTGDPKRCEKPVVSGVFFSLISVDIFVL